MKTIFLGTPEICLPVLQALKNSEKIDLALIITQVDKKVGRKQEIVFNPVKKFAIDNDVEVFQPVNINNSESLNVIKNIDPDLILVFAYGQILKKEILDLPKFGCVNIHSSLLPVHRGASPIQYAILEGDRKTGISYMKMDEKLDHGPILKKLEIEIRNRETAESLHEKLAVLAGESVVEVLLDYEGGKLELVEQNHEEATFTKILTREDGRLNFEEDYAEVYERKIRAFYPWPGTFFMDKGKRLKIFKANVIKDSNLESGEIVYLSDKILIGCKKGVLEVLEVQMEGGKRMEVSDFMRGK